MAPPSRGNREDLFSIAARARQEARTWSERARAVRKTATVLRRESQAAQQSASGGLIENRLARAARAAANAKNDRAGADSEFPQPHAERRSGGPNTDRAREIASD